MQSERKHPGMAQCSLHRRILVQDGTMLPGTWRCPVCRPAPNPTQPSQAAREDDAFERARTLINEQILHEREDTERKPGYIKINSAAGAFARFERDTEKRVRESGAGEANVERVVREAVELCKLIEKKLVPSLRPHITEAVVRLRAALATLERTTDAG